LIARIVTATEAIAQGRRWLDTPGLEGDGRKSYHEGLTLAQEAFQDAQILAPKDLESLVLAEYTFLVQEFQFCLQADTEAKASLKTALESFDDALLALKVLESGRAYRAVEDAFPHHGAAYRHKGLPKDAFHVACAGHDARLQNTLKAPGINLEEKEIVRLRAANIRLGRKIYLEKQKTALGENLKDQQEKE
jgi:nitrite reductase/ring-hydroxylating ferredoxin subunit